MYFRLRADTAQPLILTAPIPTEGGIEDAEGGDIPVYEASSFPGKEAKVTIPKLPSEPKAAVDYNKQTSALPKGSEYRLVSNRSDMKWKSAKKAVVQKLILADLTEQYGECNSTLEVRTAKTESKPYTGIRIKNDLQEAYEVCAVSGGGEPSSAAAGTKTVKAWTAPMSDSAVTNISVSKLKEGCRVYICCKADKKAQQSMVSV